VPLIDAWMAGLLSHVLIFEHEIALAGKKASLSPQEVYQLMKKDAKIITLGGPTVAYSKQEPINIHQVDTKLMS
jgi:hypothetical protein